MVVGDITKRPTVTKPFETYTKTTIQLTESNLEDEVISAVKEHENHNVNTGIMINLPLAIYQITPIIQEKFKRSAINLTLTKTEIENVKEYLL